MNHSLRLTRRCLLLLAGCMAGCGGPPAKPAGPPATLPHVDQAASSGVVSEPTDTVSSSTVQPPIEEASTGDPQTSVTEDSPDDVAPASSESSKFDGVWLIQSAELAGQPFPEQLTKTMSLTLEGENYTVLVGDRPDRGTVVRDDEASPATMDITGVEGPNAGKTFLAIYKWEGDALRICYDLSGASRPTEFTTGPGTQLFLVTYRRK